MNTKADQELSLPTVWEVGRVAGKVVWYIAIDFSLLLARRSEKYHYKK